MPAVGAYVLSVDDMMGVAQAAGLQWVISDAHKVSQAQAAIANAPKPVHVPREPKPVVVMDSGPLVLVETRQDLRNTPLPF
jgi:ribonuclease E